MPFAGHPLVGTAWLLDRELVAVDVLRPPAGEVPVRLDGTLVFVAGRPEWAPGYEWFELSSPPEVEALEGSPEDHDMGCAYAWIDQREGVVRARVFPRRIGVEEDEATGAAAVRLGALLQRDLRIWQGRGSLIHVRPRREGWIEIGGHAVLDEARDFQI